MGDTDLRDVKDGEFGEFTKQKLTKMLNKKVEKKR